MKEKNIDPAEESRVGFEALEDWVRGRIEEWVPELLEQEVGELLGRGKSELRQAHRTASMDRIPGVIKAEGGGPGDLAQLFANVETAYRLNPDLAESNMGKAFIHFREGDLDQAFEKYRIALEKGRNRHEIHMAIGYTYQRMGLSEQANPFLMSVIELAPFYLFGKYNLAWCHHYLGEFDNAESYLREALALNPRNPFSLLYLADHLLKAGNTDEAGRVLVELVSMSGAHPLE